ncbi:DUF5420 family protein [Pasteurella multocida]|uniref:DUF5420 family protein n=1 Tax=Pasteurella multocida TaxID=747 RepID=UPI0023013C93|nr:DUF5420 family protein [Pasteurella multocida]MDA5611851.1 DUF5420 family protein [Pasteurella multocida]MDA5614331.1 DUF5420 family protein [Pasteurella multocida]
MKPERRYFKCSLDKEPIKSFHTQWKNDNEKRDKELQAIFDTIPFYQYWYGDCIQPLKMRNIKRDRDFVVINGNKLSKTR